MATTLVFPIVLYSKTWRVPPMVVNDQAELDALDPNEWITSPVTPGTQKEPHWPKVYFDVNVPPVIVGSADEAKALDGRYRELSLGESVVKAAQATLDDEKSADNPPPPPAQPQ